jgi:hypothetical protein
MFWQTPPNSRHERSTVHEDWIGWLPADKRRLYERVARHWEDAYAMLSVALNDAMSFREQGEQARARENIRVAAGLVGRLVEPLLTAYHVLENRGRHLSSSPSVAPLDPANFRTQIARHTAARDLLLHRILFASRSRYSHKLRALGVTVATLAEEFSVVAEDLTSGGQTRQEECWLALDSLHYDLNTCFRETLVLLKSFLRALPEAALDGIWIELNASNLPDASRFRARLSGVPAD